MLINYLKIAVRNILKQRRYSFINIAGLTVGIASCILIYLYVGNERSYDRFHKSADYLYRIYITEAPPQRDAFSYVPAPYLLGPTLEQTIPEVEHAIRLDVRTDIVRYKENNFTERYHLADSDFFQVFSFPLLSGNKADVLRNPNSVVLTERIARKIFGNIDPMGQQLSIKLSDKFYDFTVTGIAENTPSNSSIRFDMVIPFENVHKYMNEWALNHWFDVSFETYVQLNQTILVKEMQQKLHTVVVNHYPKRSANQVSLHLQSITDIHLNPNVPQGFEPTSDPIYSIILSIVAVLILVIACINFSLLAIGSSASRMKEIGIRKVLGAVRFQIIAQFFSEILLMSFTALLFAILLVELFLPVFNSIIHKELSLTYQLWTLVFFIFLMILAGSMAGSYPAFLLSRYQPVRTIRRGSGFMSGHSLWSSGLIIGQFAISIGLVIATLVMAYQLHYMLNKDVGFNKEHLIVIENHTPPDQNRQVVERLRNALASRKEIIGISGASSSVTGNWTTMGFRNEEGEFKQFYQITVDYDYLKTMGIELLEGRNFSEEYGTDVNNAIIVNQALCKYFGWTSALGKRLPGTKFPTHKVIGVVRDFNFESLRNEIQAVVLVLDPTTLEQGINDISTSYSPELYNFINIRIKPENIQSTLNLVKETWQKNAAGSPFLFTFLDQDIQKQYQEIERWGRLTQYASIFAIAIACLGLFGLAGLSVVRRTKEIGIRKVLGASVPGILALLSGEFVKLVILANLIAAPLAWFAMNKWLQNFAYRTHIGWWVFVAAGLLAILIAILTVSTQAIKAALANPVESLRYE